MAKVPNGVEISPKFPSPEEGARTLETDDRQTDDRQTDRQTTDRRTDMKHELEFTFAKN